MSWIWSPSYCWFSVLISLESAFAWATRSCRLGIGSVGVAPPIPLGRTRLASAAAPATVAARPQSRPGLMRVFLGPLSTYLREGKCPTWSPLLGHRCTRGWPASRAAPHAAISVDGWCGHSRFGMHHQPDRLHLCIARGHG